MNAVLIAVLVMVILSLCRLNVVLSLFIGAFIGGLVAQMDIIDIITIFTDGIVGGANIALSYALLGGFAALIAYSGITEVLVHRVIQLIHLESTHKTRVITKSILLGMLIIVSMSSQNIVPVHIAFIPILIPPLLSLMNELHLDRRLIAVILTFGLTFPYVLLPIGFGQIFQSTIVTAFNNSGTDIEFNQVAPALIIPAFGFVVGLIIALFYFSKPRIYDAIETQQEVNNQLSWSAIIVALIALLATFIVQLLTESMIFGALAGVMVFFLSFKYPWKSLDDELVRGIESMAYIGVVMLAANGFATVIIETGHVPTLVEGISNLLGDSKVIIVASMLFVGLVVTMGIGSSFATIPIVASVFIPLGLELDLTTPAIIAIIGTAGALGDAGSPASDSTLGPTAGLNFDGLHDHIWDTCVPTFVFLNVPVLITGFIAAMIL